MRRKRTVFVSPHPDDAALCAGGWIHDLARSGEAAEIWTVMSGVPVGEQLSEFARAMHSKWSSGGAKETVALRKKEDRRAARILGARIVHLDFEDAIYRRGDGGMPLYADPVGAPLAPGDARLPDEICQRLLPMLHDEDRLVCPLGIGGHVDHNIVRRSAEMLQWPLGYVADIPYALRHPESLAESTAGLSSEVHPVSVAGLQAWLRAVQAYGSQLAALRDMWTPLLEGIAEWCGKQGGLRVWHRQPR